MTKRDRFLYGSLAGVAFMMWAAVFAVRYLSPWWVFVDGLLAGFLLAGPVYVEIWRRAWRHVAKEVRAESDIEVQKMFAKATRAQRAKLELGEFKPGDPCFRCGHPWPKECECIEWNVEARERHKREREAGR